MILTFPYHDPTGKYNEVFERNIGKLAKHFSKILISATPGTFEKNCCFVSTLEKENFVIFKNDKNSTIGDHFRNALKIAVENSKNEEKILYSFIDRILYILESNLCDSFSKDIQENKSDEFLIFERSQTAWSTHPQNYKYIENTVSEFFKMLSGKFIELNPCAILINKETAKTALDQSTNQTWAVLGEWILSSIKSGVNITTKKVDWLSWEDPFWEKCDLKNYKKQVEGSRDETVKRIKSNLPFLPLLTEERFANIF